MSFNKTDWETIVHPGDMLEARGRENSLGEDVDLFCHLGLELLLSEPVFVAYDPAEVLQQGGDVRQQQPGALSQ